MHTTCYAWLVLILESVNVCVLAFLYKSNLVSLWFAIPYKERKQVNSVTDKHVAAMGLSQKR